jgi:type VI secretion system protein ImpC
MSTGEQEAAVPGEAQATTKEAGLLDQIIESMPQTEPERGRVVIQDLIQEALKGQVTFDKTVSRSIKGRIAAIDEEVSKQLSEILHHPKFQKLEGSWRGLNYLVKNTNTGETLKLRVLNIGKDELRKDLESAAEFDQSEIFRKIYRDEFSTPGGIPFSAMIGDYEFTKSNDDIALLTNMSQVAAAGFCPFIAASSPELFGFSDWTALNKPRDLAKIFEGELYIKWRSFRDSEDSRFIALTMPRVMARLPYGAATRPIDEFNFEEVALGNNGQPIPVPHEQYCWMNSAYVLGARLTDAFFWYGWPTAIRGPEGGGRVDDLPAHIVQTPEGDYDMKCPTEILIDDRREYEISNQGFIALSHFKNSDYAVFFGGQTTQKPVKYDLDDATANARICARLPYILATSRFSHYLKILGRQWIGSFKERVDVEDRLNRWIAKYVCVDPKPTEEVKARLPLQAAKVQVTEDPANPGAYNAIIHMRPWLQMEELTASMRMVARIPQAK